jgi:hypothetical protein
LAESFEGIRKYVGAVPQKTDAVDLLGLLRERREWPTNSRTSEKRDELAPPHCRPSKLGTSPSYRFARPYRKGY